MTDQPNILFIHTDEQRADTLGQYGNPVVETPHIDGLAGEGALFEEAHCTHPLCSPSRGTLLTGRYPSTHGLWRNGIALPDDEQTLAGLLRSEGYATGLIGKAHFTPYNGDPEEHPESIQVDYDEPSTHAEVSSQGLDDEEVWNYWRSFDGPYYGFEDVQMTIAHGDNGIQGGHYGLWLHENHTDKTHLFSQREALEPTDPTFNSWKSAVPTEIHSTTWVAERTMDFIREHREEPFFAWVGIPDPHFPYDPPEPYCYQYDPEEVPLPDDFDEQVWENWVGELPQYVRYYLEERYPQPWDEISEEKAREVIAHYYAMVSMIDDAVGDILETVEDEGLTDDTIVVFASDHGDWLGDHGLWQKGAVHFRGVTRVPLIVRWPGVAQAGHRIEPPASLVDLVPTLLDAADAPVPYGVQGESLREVLTGETESVRPYAYVEHRHEGYRPDSSFVQNHPEAVMGGLINWDERDIHVKTVITGRHRLSHVTGVDEEYGELFDLEKDPEEIDNRWREDQELRNRLETQLIEALIAAEDPLPERLHSV